MNISARNLTVSTCGLVPRIYELADMKLQVTLAISLHSPTDEMRKKLMPIANKYSISEIMDACRYYIDKTGRRVTFEYSLVKGENDYSAMPKYSYINNWTNEKEIVPHYSHSEYSDVAA